jgi:hypothetical protein
MSLCVRAKPGADSDMSNARGQDWTCPFGSVPSLEPVRICPTPRVKAEHVQSSEPIPDMSLCVRAKPAHGLGMSSSRGEDGSCPVLCTGPGHVLPLHGTCPAVAVRNGHGTHMSDGRCQDGTCPPGFGPGDVHLERISGTRLDRVLTGYIESSLALSLGGC